MSMSVAPRAGEPQKKPWTVLYYGSGDNLLTPYMHQNLKDMEAVGSTDQVNIVTQFDAENQGATRRLMLKGDAPAGVLASPVVEALGQTNMARPETLSDFIKWGVEHYPAEHYMVVMAGFANGWSGAMLDVGDHSLMSLPEIHQALSSAREATGTKIDVLGFDAEFMGMAEVAHELSDDAHYLVASQHSEKKERWSYASLLSTAFPLASGRCGGPAPEEVAKAVVTGTADRPKGVPTMAAYDMSHEPRLAEGIRSLSEAIQASSLSKEAVERIKADTQHYLIDSYVDLHDLCTRILDEPTSEPRLKAAAIECQQAIAGFVIAERHSKWLRHSHGVSIDLQYGYPDYAAMRFAQDTQWNAAQDRLARDL